MRIGIIPSDDRLDGGQYQYSLSIIDAIGRMNLEDEFVLFHKPETDLPLDELNTQGWKTVPLVIEQPLSFRRIALNAMRRTAIGKAISQVWRNVCRRFFPPPLAAPPAYLTGDFDQIIRKDWWRCWFERQGIELMIYTAPTTLSFEVGLPYIATVYDLQHRLQPEFQEVSTNGEWEWREYFFRNSIRYATLVLVDSEVGKEDVLEFYGPYGATPDKVKVLPYLPAYYHCNHFSGGEDNRIRKAYNLPSKYLFYPAQFWPHKNHLRIVQALRMLKEGPHLDVHVVLVGSYTCAIMERAFRDVMALASQAGVAKQVHYLGYVPDQDMSALYGSAIGLIMPTFFGPTNIPILEAWVFGCPVLTSNIRGIREQVGDAGILVNPRSVEAIAQGIRRLWIDSGLREDLAKRGRQRLSAFTPDDFRRRLERFIEEAKKRVRELK